MKLSDLGEFGLIQKIRRSAGRPAPPVVIGIGDDAAALRLSPAATLLATTDMLLEGVHFDLSYSDFYSLGWKSAAANLSDIAAMGGLPRFCLISLGIPSSVPVENIASFYRGLETVLRAHGTHLVGGDTCLSRGGFVVNVAVLGESGKTRIVTRAGAKPGDRIFVTGTLGDSAAGLEILRNAPDRIIRGQAPCGMRNEKPGRTKSEKQRFRCKDLKSEIRNLKSAMKSLTTRHLRPTPRVEWGRAIARAGCANAMIDVSDGLSSDLGHICEQSRVGAVIYAEKVPLSPALRRASGSLSQPSLSYALSGGEDYELLFTVPQEKMRKCGSLNIAATEIGEIVSGTGIRIVEKGREKRLRLTGYDHFAGMTGR